MQDNKTKYYLVVDDKPTGPLSLDELILHPALSPDTLVWKPGIEKWTAAKNFTELKPAFVVEQRNDDRNNTQVYIENSAPNRNSQEFENREANQPQDQPNQFGNQGREQANPFADNPQYNPNHTYDPHQRGNNRGREDSYNQGGYNQGGYNQGQGGYNQGGYNQGGYNQGGYHHHQGGYRPTPEYDHDHYGPHHTGYRDPYNNNGYGSQMHTNWLPWAIVATVVGFFTSCVGVIFGIIGIVQANKANTLYAQGYDHEGDAANSNAKVMTIIALALAALGLIILFSVGNVFNSILY